jgi:hypothetical protein
VAYEHQSHEFSRTADEPRNRACRNPPNRKGWGFLTLAYKRIAPWNSPTGRFGIFHSGLTQTTRWPAQSFNWETQ